MHSIDTRNEFVVLRSQGLSFDKISAKLGVSKATLGRWHYENLHEIQLLRALQWEHLEDELGHRLEDSLKLIAQRIRRLETELDSRQPESFTRTELSRVIRTSRLEYLKLRSIVLAPLGPPKKAIALMQAAAEKRDEMRQDPEPPNETPNKTNEVQPEKTPPSHSSSGHPVAPDLRAEPRCKTDSNSRGHFSSKPSVNPAPQPADAVHNPTNHNGRATCPHGAASNPAADSHAPKTTITPTQAVPSPSGCGRSLGEKRLLSRWGWTDWFALVDT